MKRTLLVGGGLLLALAGPALARDLPPRVERVERVERIDRTERVERARTEAPRREGTARIGTERPLQPTPPVRHNSTTKPGDPRHPEPPPPEN